MKPDYGGGGLVNLLSSIVDACGGRARHAPLVDLGAAELAQARNVVLFVIDGLGDGFLRRHGAGGELARRRRAAISSVFPPTTASAITTTYTGCTPLEHGLTGWFTYFGEAGCVAAALPFRGRGEHLPLSHRGVNREKIYARPGLFESLPVRSIVVTYRDIVDSDYNQHHCRGAERVACGTLQELVAGVEAAVKSGPERKFLYVYWPEYDMASHPRGFESAAALEKFGAVDEAFGDLLARLSGTESIVIATADHGFIDSGPEETLELPAALAAQLRLPLSGERRVAYCHVHAPEDFARRARDWLGERADVMPSARLVAEGWFGPGTPHPRFAERVGDVALVMREHYTVKDWTPGEPRHLHIGNHGGTSEDEMMIPLIVEAA